MPVPMYDLTVPVLNRGFAVLSDYIDKSVVHAEQNKVDPMVLFNARLAPDMMPFSAQVQRASDSAKGAMARLTGVENPNYPDTEATFEQLKQRIAKTLAFVNGVDRGKFEGSETRTVMMKFGSATRTFRGDAYVLQVLLPNFFFHVATAHDILRHSGLKIGKTDYFGTFDTVDSAA